jgi:membrane-associated phospholipid phosphatase
MVIFRMIAMYLLPLDPPPAMIPLQDPMVEFFGTGKLLTRDLFFSGHTSTLFLLFLVTPRGILKSLFLGCTILVAVAVLVQHVHYTIDVFAAPFFAYAAVKLADRIFPPDLLTGQRSPFRI